MIWFDGQFPEFAGVLQGGFPAYDLVHLYLRHHLPVGVQGVELVLGTLDTPDRGKLPRAMVQGDNVDHLIADHLSRVTEDLVVLVSGRSEVRADR